MIITLITQKVPTILVVYETITAFDTAYPISFMVHYKLSNILTVWISVRCEKHYISYWECLIFLFYELTYDGSPWHEQLPRGQNVKCMSQAIYVTYFFFQFVIFLMVTTLIFMEFVHASWQFWIWTLRGRKNKKKKCCHWHNLINHRNLICRNSIHCTSWLVRHGLITLWNKPCLLSWHKTCNWYWWQHSWYYPPPSMTSI